MTRTRGSDRGGIDVPTAVVIAIIGLIVSLIVGGTVAFFQKKSWVETVERRYDITLVGERDVKTSVGSITTAKIEVDGKIVPCDILTREYTFTITCDSPDGRITLEEK